MNPIQWIAKLLNRGKSVLPDYQSIPYNTPPFNPNSPIPLGGKQGGYIMGTPPIHEPQDDELSRIMGQQSDNETELARLRQGADASMATLGQAPPKPESADPNFAETAAGLIGMILGKPQGNVQRTRYESAPMVLAQNRADLANKQAGDVYGAQQQGARSTLQGQIGMIGQAQDRGAALDRVREQLVSKQAQVVARANVAAIRTNGQFWTAAAKLIGEGKATPEALAGTYQMMNPGADPREVQAAVDQMVQDPMTQQNLYQANEQEKGAIAQQKVDQTRIDSARKVARDPNATSFDKAEAYWTLQQAGALPPNFDIQKAIDEKGSVTQKNEAQAANTQAKTKETLEMLPLKVREKLASIGLKSEQTKLLAKRVSSFDDEFKSRVAERWARVAHLGTSSTTTRPEGIRALEGLKSIYQHQIDAMDKKRNNATFGFGDWSDADEQRYNDLQDDMRGIEQQYQQLLTPPEPTATYNPVAQGGFDPLAQGGSPHAPSKKQRQMRGTGDLRRKADPPDPNTLPPGVQVTSG